MLYSLKMVVRVMLTFMFVSLAGIHLSAQSKTDQSREVPLRLRRLSLFSSGVGFFEHAETVTGSVDLSIPFKITVINDALKSLVINDPGSSPSVVYASEQTLERTLRSLKIDLSGNPGLADILGNLKGAEIEVYTPNSIRGRIITVEYRSGDPEKGMEPWLSLYTDQGIRAIALKDITSFTFKDTKITADLNRALDLLMASRDADTQNLTIRLPGESRRDISLSYVIPTPVWKVSYRLDLSAGQPFLQAWAIVDNDSDIDWNNVELSLVTGRPVSFIQNLYAPYHLTRPVLPLAIAGIAEAQTYDSGSKTTGFNPNMFMYSGDPVPSPMRSSMEKMEKIVADEADASPAAAQQNPAGGMLDTVQGQDIRDQFEFTLNKPVTLSRQQSAMLPLAAGPIPAEKTLVFSGSRALNRGPIHPAISTELTNTLGMKLPAGPITVYDDGTYAGDALIEFFPEQEKRLISYGEDLSVTGSIRASNTQLITTVSIQQGIMTINRKQSYEKVYTFRNASGTSKQLIVEHPISPGTTLMVPSAYDKRTDSLYRFVLILPQEGEHDFIVQEEQPLAQRIALTQLSLHSFLSYTTNEALPEQVRTALQNAVALKQKVDNAKQLLTDLNKQRERLVSDQDRTRQNLAVIGIQTQQGQEYLKRLLAQDDAIDAVDTEIAGAEEQVQETQHEYDTYLGALDL